MRVTKIVREYIEEQVGKVYAEKTAEEKEYDFLCTKLNDFVNAIDNEVDHMVDEAIARFREENDIPLDVELKHSHYTAVKKETWGTQIRLKSDRAREKRVKERDEKVRDIILTLELGGTKADLDRMIAELKI